MKFKYVSPSIEAILKFPVPPGTIRCMNCPFKFGLDEQCFPNIHKEFNSYEAMLLMCPLKEVKHKAERKTDRIFDNNRR